MQFVHARREACQYANHGYLDAVIEAINPCEDRPDDRQHGSHLEPRFFCFLCVDSCNKHLDTHGYILYIGINIIMGQAPLFMWTGNDKTGRGRPHA